MITGQEQPDAGALRVGDTVKIAYADQSRDLRGVPRQATGGAAADIRGVPRQATGGAAADDLEPDRAVWEAISDGRDVVDLGGREVPARSYAAAFNFKGSDQQKRVKDLSGGERNRLHLARTLRAGGNLLLLDEPTNDLDVDTLRALEEALLAFAGCAVVISHDRWFLDRIATHILAFEGDSQVVWFEGNYEAYEADRRRRLGAEADQPHRIRYKRLAKA
jgi:ATPase subunit of ABC transporter with duplicated ATPase domains